MSEVYIYIGIVLMLAAIISYIVGKIYWSSLSYEEQLSENMDARLRVLEHKMKEYHRKKEKALDNLNTKRSK